MGKKLGTFAITLKQSHEAYVAALESSWSNIMTLI